MARFRLMRPFDHAETANTVFGEAAKELRKREAYRACHLFERLRDFMQGSFLKPQRWTPVKNGSLLFLCYLDGNYLNAVLQSHED